MWPHALSHTTPVMSLGSATGLAPRAFEVPRRRPRNQIGPRALLGMDGRKPYETPQWRPGNEGREAMCCSFCGGRDHSYEDCPRMPVPFLPAEPEGEDIPGTPDR